MARIKAEPKIPQVEMAPTEARQALLEMAQKADDDVEGSRRRSAGSTPRGPT
ncbi:MAG: hypothetical protein OXF79_23730 [Chloroflexi bacterium]|nr:hypothetical protein [Chloroflexota bacterium]